MTINEWDQGIPVNVAYLDFRNAFDSVPPQETSAQDEGYGVDGNFLLWIEDFLKDRMQFVSVNWLKSERVIVTRSCGVPQGSGLGTTLSIYYINDLPSVTDSRSKSKIR